MNLSEQFCYRSLYWFRKSTLNFTTITVCCLRVILFCILQYPGILILPNLIQYKVIKLFLIGIILMLRCILFSKSEFSVAQVKELPESLD